MKEIKCTRQIEEVVAYEASDGTRFKSKEACETYENTAKVVIFNEFKQLIVGEPFSECSIWENYGYGGEEFELAVIEIKNADDLHTANMFSEAYGFDYIFSNELIGKRVLVNLGYHGSYGDCGMNPRTEEELVESFKKNLKYFFYTEKERGENNDNT